MSYSEKSNQTPPNSLQFNLFHQQKIHLSECPFLSSPRGSRLLNHCSEQMVRKDPCNSVWARSQRPEQGHSSQVYSLPVQINAGTSNTFFWLRKQTILCDVYSIFLLVICLHCHTYVLLWVIYKSICKYVVSLWWLDLINFIKYMLLIIFFGFHQCSSVMNLFILAAL